MKRKPVWIFAPIVALLLVSTLLWNFWMQAAGPAGRGAKGRGAAADPAENFDIRDQENKSAVLEFERRMEKFSSKEKEKNDNFKLAMKGAQAKKARVAVPELEVSFCSLTNSPEVVQSTGKGRKFLTPSSKQPRESVVRS